MKTSYLALSLMICSSIFLLSCAEDKGTVTSPPDMSNRSQESPLESSSEDMAKAKIIDILSNYYTDLAAENLNEHEYFAPKLEQFFSSSDIPREKVGQSLRNGFKTVEDRHITFDPKSLRIQKTANGYESTFQGQSIHKRTSDGQQITADFSNKVGFNKDFQIIAYGGADDKAKQKSRSLEAANASAPSSVDGAAGIAKTVLEEFKSGNFAKCKALIHPKYGFYMVGQPGAYSVPYHLNSFEEIFKKAPWLKKGTEMYTNLQAEPIPEFTCEGDNYFAKEGCFI
ncbi:MAG: hypothetical protein AAF696_10555, partial [Bacteroidota bacterium]